MILAQLASAPTLRRILRRIRARWLPQQMEPVEADATHCCAVCGSATPFMPSQGECGHTGCYYCLASQLHDSPDAPCLRCGRPLRSVQWQSSSSSPR